MAKAPRTASKAKTPANTTAKAKATPDSAPSATVEAPKPKAPGVIATIREVLTQNREATVKEIHSALVTKFPDRDPKGMLTTVRIQRNRWLKEN